MTAEITLVTWADARDAFRHRDLRQALYDEGRDLMGTVVVNLHGDEHRDRRRLEHRLFSPATVAHYETELLPGLLDAVLAPALAAGHGELGDLARRTMLRLSAAVAGVDVTDADFDAFYALMTRMSRASVVVHAALDAAGKAAIVADGQAALAEFDTQFYRPSLARRTSEPERDILSTLLANQDRLDLPPEVVLREVAYYPWVGTHSTSVALVWVMHHLFAWSGTPPMGPAEVRRFVHETLRLHPASPVAVRRALAPVRLRSGVQIPEGAMVRIDVVAANQDPGLFGADPGRFDPFRAVHPQASPWGLSFGSGFHSCLGADLAGGSAEVAGSDNGTHFGALATMAATLLAHGARPDPDDPATEDTTTVRRQWGRYPVVFDAKPASAAARRSLVSRDRATTNNAP